MSTIKFITLCAFYLPFICNGQIVETKLNCQLNTKTTIQKGGDIYSEKETINVIFEIQQLNSNFGIFTDNSIIPNLSTIKKDNIVSVTNNSDSNKWSLNNIVKTKVLLSDTTIIIDRNTGILLYVQKINQNNSQVDTEGQGTCKKVDTTKRLF